MRLDLRTSLVLTLNTTPKVMLMRDDPFYDNWTTQLRTIAADPILLKVQHELEHIADSGNPFIYHNPTGGISHDEFNRISEFVEKILPQSPAPCFVIAMNVTFAWCEHRGGAIYDLEYGLPDDCWVCLPYICALASSKLGGTEGATQLINLAFDVFDCAKYPSKNLFLARDRYQALLSDIQYRRNHAIRDLSNEIRKSCEPNRANNSRAIIGAMFWTVGLIPESVLYHANSKSIHIPSYRLCRWLVRYSLDVVETDSLLQSLWLLLKNCGAVNIRQHAALFRKLDMVYRSRQVDNLAAKYARFIVSWFRTDLSPDMIFEYYNACSRAEQYSACDLRTSVRLFCLYKKVKSESMTELVDTGKDQNEWGEILGEVVSDYATIEKGHLGFAGQAVSSELSTPLFYFIDHSVNIDEDFLSSFFRLEGFRVCFVYYWFFVNPLFLTDDEKSQLGNLLEDERSLIRMIRSEYFISIYDSLPRHYDRFSFPLVDGRVTSPSALLSPEQALKRIVRLKEQLATLYERMRNLVPKYVRQREEPTVTTKDIGRILNAHRYHPGA